MTVRGILVLLFISGFVTWEGLVGLATRKYPGFLSWLVDDDPKWAAAVTVGGIVAMILLGAVFFLFAIDRLRNRIEKLENPDESEEK